MTILKGGGGRDDERFEAIYRKFYARVYRYFQRECGIADDEAHDLAQDTFKRIYVTFSKYRGEAEWGFIQKTAKNVVLNWLRARTTQKRSATMIHIDDPELLFDPPAPEEPDLAEREHAEQRRRELVRAVSELPEAQRESLRLSILGFKYTEIAKALNTSVDAVKSRLRDAKRYLRTRLGDKS